MLLITIDELTDEQVQYLSKINVLMSTQLETDLNNPSLPLENVEILITYGFNVTKENLDRMPSLKWIQVFQSGVEHIPLQDVNDRGIMITNVKGIHRIPMAEYVMSVVLYYMRDIERFNRDQKEHMWNRDELVDEAYGKTIAVFGAGTIGSAIAEKAKAFGMKTIGVNTSGKQKAPFDDMYTLSQKNEVLEKSDFVVLLLPVTDETYHCIGKEEITKMKDSAYLINIGRGQLVDTDALIGELKQKTIQGAVLDVFEEDPLPKEHPLWDLENVMITPHLAAKTVRYLDRCIEKFEGNLKCYETNQPLVNVVDIKRGY
jgi:phosphoglycerate dehydrogenase-like enzyme